ncbi:hypothetical protein Lfu02_27880 [Longispora fulva]|uniref:DUF4328 domain-containing protein n=1 Tax=Longispora fulva TaxID=619741 RepID=A0A8J7GH35_9ACTN|nr:DUF4328 domain-containing protein [Longispora fulva]MBG6138924.1 hypothetical protein [Longispora fulva]GIG58416.1 hypothetical protein Lfu02_27880 [Longispora fulva]
MHCPSCNAALSETDPACRTCGLPAGLVAQPRPLLSLTGPAIGSYVAVAVSLVGLLIATLSPLLEIAVVRSDAEFNYGVLVELAGYLLLILGLVAGVVFMVIWTYRARKNTDLIPDAWPQQPVWMSVGGWFIPLAQYVLVPMALKDIALNSEPAPESGRTKVSGSLITWWWLTFFAFNCVSRLGNANDGEIDTEFYTPYSTGESFDVDKVTGLLGSKVALGLPGLVALTAAGVLAVIVIRGITAAQVSRQPRIW